MTGFVKKSFAGVAAAVLVVSAYFVIGVLLFANAQYSDINAMNLEGIIRTLGSLTPASVFTDAESEKAWVAGIPASALPYRITLIRRNGQVIYDSNTDSATMENHLDRPEFQAAIRGGLGTARRRSATLGQEYIYTALDITDGGADIAGVLRVSTLVPSLYSRLFVSAFPFLLFGIFLIAATCAGLYRFARHLSFSIEAKLNTELQTKTLELKERTEEAELESRLRESILNSMFDGIIAMDNKLRITMVNHRFCSLFGIETEKDTRGMPLLEFSHSVELEEAALKVLSLGEPAELTLKRYVSGSEQHFKVFAAPLKASPLGNTQGVIIVLGDISRLVKLEQIRKDFAANVSHELRTPIQVVKGFAENILNSSMDNKDELRHFVEIIGKNAQTMENLSNDLLTLVSLESSAEARMGRGSPTVDGSEGRAAMEEIFLAPLIAEAADMVEIAAKKKDITIDISCPAELKAKLYELYIIQAIVNLLDNGIKYSSPGSRVKVGAFREGEQLIIEVKDSGIGIPAEHLSRIFERFYRVDKARSREQGGTGLGLSIVRHIALLHNGTAEAESHAGEGSLFRLKLGKNCLSAENSQH